MFSRMVPANTGEKVMPDEARLLCSCARARAVTKTRKAQTHGHGFDERKTDAGRDKTFARNAWTYSQAGETVGWVSH